MQLVVILFLESDIEQSTKKDDVGFVLEFGEVASCQNFGFTSLFIMEKTEKIFSTIVDCILEFGDVSNGFLGNKSFLVEKEPVTKFIDFTFFYLQILEL